MRAKKFAIGLSDRFTVRRRRALSPISKQPVSKQPVPNEPSSRSKYFQQRCKRTRNSQQRKSTAERHAGNGAARHPRRYHHTHRHRRAERTGAGCAVFEWFAHRRNVGKGRRSRPSWSDNRHLRQQPFPHGARSSRSKPRPGPSANHAARSQTRTS